MKGFTLVETLLTTSIAVIVGIVLLSIFLNHTGVFYKQNALVTEGLGLNDAMSVLSNQIRQGVSVAAGYPESSPTILSSDTVLVLKLPALSSSGVISNVYDFVAIFPDLSTPTVLRMQTFPDPASIRPGSNQVLTTLLQSVKFTYYDHSGNVVTPTNAALVGVDLTVLSKTGSIGSSRTTKAVVDLRNH